MTSASSGLSPAVASAVRGLYESSLKAGVPIAILGTSITGGKMPSTPKIEVAIDTVTKIEDGPKEGIIFVSTKRGHTMAVDLTGMPGPHSAQQPIYAPPQALNAEFASAGAGAGAA